MKDTYLKKAFSLFEAFKSHKLTEDDISKAEGKADNLSDKTGDFKMLLQMAKDTFAGKYKMSAWNMSVIVGTIVYVISPIDAIPDVIPVLGWLDDVTIVGYAIKSLAEEIKKYKEFAQA